MIFCFSIVAGKFILLPSAHRFLFACLHPFCILVSHFKLDCVSVSEMQYLEQESSSTVQFWCQGLQGFMIAPPVSQGRHFSIAVPLKRAFLIVRGYLVIYFSVHLKGEMFLDRFKKQIKTSLDLRPWRYCASLLNTTQSETHNSNSSLRLSYLIKANLYLNSICGFTVPLQKHQILFVGHDI